MRLSALFIFCTLCLVLSIVDPSQQTSQLIFGSYALLDTNTSSNYNMVKNRIITKIIVELELLEDKSLYTIHFTAEVTGGRFHICSIGNIQGVWLKNGVTLSQITGSGLILLVCEKLPENKIKVGRFKIYAHVIKQKVGKVINILPPKIQNRMLPDKGAAQQATNRLQINQFVDTTIKHVHWVVTTNDRNAPSPPSLMQGVGGYVNGVKKGTIHDGRNKPKQE